MFNTPKKRLYATASLAAVLLLGTGCPKEEAKKTAAPTGADAQRAWEPKPVSICQLRIRSVLARPLSTPHELRAPSVNAPAARCVALEFDVVNEGAEPFRVSFGWERSILDGVSLVASDGSTYVLRVQDPASGPLDHPLPGPHALPSRAAVRVTSADQNRSWYKVLGVGAVIMQCPPPGKATLIIDAEVDGKPTRPSDSGRILERLDVEIPAPP